MTGFLGGGLVWVVRVMWLVRPPGRWLFVLDRGSVVVAIACGAVGGRGRGGPVMGGLFCGERRGRKFVPVHGVVRGEEESQSCNMTKALYIELWQYSISAPFLTTLCQGPYSHAYRSQTGKPSRIQHPVSLSHPLHHILQNSSQHPSLDAPTL